MSVDTPALQAYVGTRTAHGGDSGQRLPSGDLTFVNAVIPHQTANVESSLYRNGKVLTKRDLQGSDNKMVGVEFDLRSVKVHNGRLAAVKQTLEANGYELCPRPMPDSSLDFYNEQWIMTEYYADCCKVLKEHTGAAHVFAFDHNLRSAGGKKAGAQIAGGNAVQSPAFTVHGDYTLTSAPQRLRDLAESPRANDTLRKMLGSERSLLEPALVERVLGAPGSRWAIINVWRNIRSEPVQKFPLAVCDGQSVRPEDLVVFEIHYADRIGENYFAKHDPGHQWYYYPRMTRDEVLLLKQWDSAGELARSGGKVSDSDGKHRTSTFSFHSAFTDPTSPADAPDRESIEVRCIVIYDDGMAPSAGSKL